MKRAKAGVEQPSCVLSSLKIKDNSMQLWREVQFLPQMHQKQFGCRDPDPLWQFTTLTHTL